jgi:hypothetical protein
MRAGRAAPAVRAPAVRVPASFLPVTPRPETTTESGLMAAAMDHSRPRTSRPGHHGI